MYSMFSEPFKNKYFTMSLPKVFFFFFFFSNARRRHARPEGHFKVWATIFVLQRPLPPTSRAETSIVSQI